MAVSGSRDWGEDRYEEVEQALLILAPSFVILGDARGVDTLARRVCIEHWIRYRVHKADWERYGRGAGHIRNTAMLKDEPDLLVWFHDDLDASKGTKDCVAQAERMGLIIVCGRRWTE